MNFCNLVYNNGRNALHSNNFSRTIKSVLESREIEFEEKNIGDQPIYILKKNIYDGPAKVFSFSQFAELF